MSHKFDMAHESSQIPPGTKNIFAFAGYIKSYLHFGKHGNHMGKETSENSVIDQDCNVQFSVQYK